MVRLWFVRLCRDEIILPLVLVLSEFVKTFREMMSVRNDTLDDMKRHETYYN